VSTGRIVPVIPISNTTGQGVDILLELLNLLPPRLRWEEKRQGALLAYVSDLFDVRGVGPVVAVTVLRGVVKENSTLFIGPFHDGSWRMVRVRSIHVNRVPVAVARAGEEATLAITGAEVEELEKGMTVAEAPLQAVWEFDAEILVLKHPSTIRPGYQTVFHAFSIRSPVVFEEMEKEPMRTGDRGLVKLRFLYHPLVPRGWGTLCATGFEDQGDRHCEASF